MLDGPGTVRVAFRVADTGIGIPRGQQAIIFEPFRQADGSVNRKYGGTGLGLAISSRFIALMGGRLSVDSEPGRGSSFSFEASLWPLPPAGRARRRPRKYGTFRSNRPRRAGGRG